MPTTTDICIIGGGPAGSVLGARLAQFGLDVCLVERVAFPRRHLGESLAPGVLPLLKSIGAGPATLLGIALTVLVLVLLTTAAIVPLRALWARVAVRVAGSWVAAVGMLMLGWLAQGT